MENPIDPIYSNIILEPTNKIIVAYSGNGRTACRVILRSKATVLELPSGCGEFIIPVALLRKLIKPDAEGTLSIDVEDTHICLKSSQLNAKLIYDRVSTGGFIKVPFIPPGTEPISFTAEQLRFISRTLLPLSGNCDFNHYSENGISFDSFGGDLQILAMDSSREIAAITSLIPWPHLTEKVVPAFLLEAIKNHIYPEDTSFRFYFTRNEVYIVGDKFQCYSTLNQGLDNNLKIKKDFKWTDYTDTFFGDTYLHGNFCIENKQEFINAIECCLAFNDNNLLVIDLQQNALSITSFLDDCNYFEVKVDRSQVKNEYSKFLWPGLLTIDGLALLKAITYCSDDRVMLNLYRSRWNTSKLFFELDGIDVGLSVYLDLDPVNASIVNQTKFIS
ncbi:MAG: hypothetical protein ABJH04_07400 [Cyclobacteriaceae bacterium]